MADKITYKITGILTLYKVTTENVIHVAINGDIKSPDGKNLFFRYENDNCVNAKIFGVDETFTISNELKHTISSLFSNKQKATFLISFLVKEGKNIKGNIEGVEIKQS